MRRERMKSLEFRKLVDRFLGADNFQEEKRYKGIKHHKVWVGWKIPKLDCILGTADDAVDSEVDTTPDGTNNAGHEQARTS